MNLVQVRKKVIVQFAKIKSKKGVYTFVLKPEDYSTTNQAICSYLTKTFKFSGVYISLNNDCHSLLVMFDKEKIEAKRLLFIDGTDQEQKSKISNCISLKNNRSLTELSILISETCRNEKIEFVFFDSLSTLLIYNNLETTERFIHYIINKFKHLNLFVVLISIEDEKSNKLIPLLSQFCDKLIKI